MATKADTRMTPLKLFSYTMMAFWLIVAAFPFLWTFWGSFKVQADFLSKADWMNAVTGANTIKQTGSAYTGQGYYGAWVEEDFWFNFKNTTIVVFFTVVISLTFGTLEVMRWRVPVSGMRFGFSWLRSCFAP